MAEVAILIGLQASGKTSFYRSVLAATHGRGFSRFTSTADKNEILFEHGINFNELPAWQRRGIALWWEGHSRTGHDPVREVEVVATRRHVHVERGLPMKDDYRALVTRLIGAP